MHRSCPLVERSPCPFSETLMELVLAFFSASRTGVDHEDFATEPLDCRQLMFLPCVQFSTIRPLLAIKETRSCLDWLSSL
jgi:hypothetical protein